MKKAITLIISIVMIFSLIGAVPTPAAPPITGETWHGTNTIAPGVVYSLIQTPASSFYKKQSINIVEVDMTQQNLYLDVAYGNMSNMFAGSTVKNTMQNFAAANPTKTPLFAVNGAPWNVAAMSGSSSGARTVFPWTFGFTYTNGEIYCTNDDVGDFAVGIAADYTPIFGAPNCAITLTQGTKVAQSSSINRIPKNNRIVIYTDRVMGSTANIAAPDAYELLVDFGFDYTLTHGTNITGTIIGVYAPGGPTTPTISANQMVLTARGTAIADLQQFTVGQPITVNVNVYDLLGNHSQWQTAQSIAGGFFPLMINGTTIQHNFNQNFPATIVGTNLEGKFVMITLDGRGTNGGCVGLNQSYIHENLLSELGMYNALLLDGGGSSTMIFHNTFDNSYNTLNTPSDGSLRAVKNAWILSTGPQHGSQGGGSNPPSNPEPPQPPVNPGPEMPAGGDTETAPYFSGGIMLAESGSIAQPYKLTMEYVINGTTNASHHTIGLCTSYNNGGFGRTLGYDFDTHNFTENIFPKDYIVLNGGWLPNGSGFEAYSPGNYAATLGTGYHRFEYTVDYNSISLVVDSEEVLNDTIPGVFTAGDKCYFICAGVSMDIISAKLEFLSGSATAEPTMASCMSTYNGIWSSIICDASYQNLPTHTVNYFPTGLKTFADCLFSCTSNDLFAATNSALAYLGAYHLNAYNLAQTLVNTPFCAYYGVGVQISNIGYVTQSSLPAIVTAENAYNALSASNKAKVSNYAMLVAARNSYNTLFG